ncbi:MAG: CheR family methyltransferase [Pseudomonadota bacterium]|nr:CheR family methyltransferase [Pseudomonadota bacterium]
MPELPFNLSGGNVPLSPEEFRWISAYLHAQTGILLNDGKQALVMGRLEKRLRHHGLNCYGDYFELFGAPGHVVETTLAIDLLTTNETYFFREHKHFDFLRQQVIPKHPRARPLRIWSAASSSGEEAYTLAMTLAESFPEGSGGEPGGNWEIVGTDISTRVLETARRGVYPLSAAEKIAPPLLKKHCLKGRDEYAGYFLVSKALRARVQFQYANLMETLPDLGQFDVIFLRNVMIYFDMPTKQRLVEKLLERLKPGGYFMISHSETLNGINGRLKAVQPAVYQLPV